MKEYYKKYSHDEGNIVFSRNVFDFMIVDEKEWMFSTLLPRLRALRPLVGQLKILRLFVKQIRQKRANAPFIIAIIF